MNGEALLDYAEFQLSPRRTRCELFLSADGVAEKLASGFLKPFLMHLRAAEAQVAKGSWVIRLEADLNISKQTNNTWFTKGTVERFLRFVSTPEVIERVKTIEDELAQLQQVRNALADTFVQTEETSTNPDTNLSPSGAYRGRDSMSIVPRRQSTDAHNNRGETSKRELLKAMDIRLTALKQEQNLAFSRATAAGFDSDNMVDLMTFAKHFGADRLNDACVHFIALFKKRKVFSNGRNEEVDSPSEKPELSSGSLASATEIHLPEESGVPSKLKSRNSDSWLDRQKLKIDTDFSENAVDWHFNLRQHEKVNSSVDNAVIRTRSNMDTRKRWGPPEKLQMDHSSSEIHMSQDMVEPGKATNTKNESKNCAYQDEKRFGENGMAPLQGRGSFRAAISPQQASDILPDSNQKPLPGHSPRDQKSETVSKVDTLFAHKQKMAEIEASRSGGDIGGTMHSTSRGVDDLSEPGSQVTMHEASSSWRQEPAQYSCDSSQQSMVHVPGDQSNIQSHIYEVKNVHSSSSCPERSSLLSARKVHPRIWRTSSTQDANDSLCSDGTINQNNSLKKLEDNNAVDGAGNKAKYNQEESLSTPVRRLSVQDAISIFEGKKKESGESPLRKRGKEEIRRGSMESGSLYTSEKAVLRRWSAVSLPSSGESFLQEKGTVLGSTDAMKNLEPDFAKNKDEANKNSLIDDMLTNNNLSLSVVEEQKHKNISHIVQSQQPEESGSSTRSEADTLLLKQGTNVQQLSPGSISFNGPGVNIQKQSKPLTREAPNVCTVVSSKTEVDSGKVSTISTVRSLSNSFTKSNLESQSVVKNMLLDAKGKIEREETNGQVRKLLLPAQGTSVSDEPKVAVLVTQEHDNAGYGKTNCLKHELVDLKETKTVEFNEAAKDSSQALSKARSVVFPRVREHNSANKSSANLGTTADDVHMQTLGKMVNNPSSRLSSEESPCGNRGRCYENYRKLRDARLRDEHPAKRAERQAKLKFMQEILERRKEEMEAIAVRTSKKNYRLSQVLLGVEKVQTQKSGLLTSQIEQKELGDEKKTDQEDCSSQKQDRFYEYSNPTSPASMPHLSRNQASGLKPRAVKRASPPLLKPSTPPRNSIRAAGALSPRSSPKNPLGTKSPTANHNGTVDISIIKSVPILADLRKETAKPSSAHAAASARAHPKVSGHSQTLNDAASQDENGNSISTDDASSLSRKSCTNVSEYKISSFDERISGSLKGQQEGLTELTVNGRVRSAVTLTQEVKPFLRKGQGIGPGAGLGIMKQKASISMEGSKSSDEAVPIESMMNGKADEPDNFDTDFIEAEESKSSLVTNNLGSSAENREDEVSVTSNVLVMHISNDSRAPSVNDDMPANIHVGPSNYLPENALNHGRICHSTFCHTDVHDEKHQCHLNGDSVFVTRGFFPNGLTYMQKEGALCTPSSELVAQRNTEPLRSSASVVASSGSFQDPSLVHEHITSPFCPAASSLTNSSMLQPGAISGYYSSPPDLAMESILNSPTIWNLPETQYTSEADLVSSRRQFSGPQRPAPIMTLPPKESAKGFKRLLHFGRKRAAETATTDCVSVSTTSEGDDDTEEARDLARQFSDDFLQRTRLQERGFDSGSTGDHNPFQEQVAIQLLRSSIPAPPTNFKLREDHLSGGTFVKAPRSFFSLSSFRSRTTEGKLR